MSMFQKLFKIIAKEKPFRISPKKNIDNNANRVVIEIHKVLDNVSLIEIFVVHKSLYRYCFLDFLTLSKITTVSFIE